MLPNYDVDTICWWRMRKDVAFRMAFPEFCWCFTLGFNDFATKTGASEGAIVDVLSAVDESPIGSSPVKVGNIWSNESEHPLIRQRTIMAITHFNLTPTDRLFSKVIALFFLIQINQICKYM